MTQTLNFVSKTRFEFFVKDVSDVVNFLQEEHIHVLKCSYTTLCSLPGARVGKL